MTDSPYWLWLLAAWGLGNIGVLTYRILAQVISDWDYQRRARRAQLWYAKQREQEIVKMIRVGYLYDHENDLIPVGLTKDGLNILWGSPERLAALIVRGRNRMYVCPKCGSKRCPNATWHGADCTGSNAPGQAGFRYAVEWPTND